MQCNKKDAPGVRSRASLYLGAAICMVTATLSQAATFTFNDDPFAGSTALTTPGRQIVQGEPSINFNSATDNFAFNPAVFNVGSSISFANGPVGSLPTSAVNAVVLQTLDNDGNAATPFGAGNAATLIANQLIAPGSGFFIYFNSALNLDRLVFSTNLDDPTADLAVLARFPNLTGQAGIDALPTFTASNFTLAANTPEPSSMLLIGVSFTLLGAGYMKRRKKLPSSTR